MENISSKLFYTTPDSIQEVNDSEINCNLFVYRVESGRVGLDSDTTGSNILTGMLFNSATWDFRLKEVRFFDEIKFKDPFVFLSKLRPTDRLTRLITFHRIDEASNFDVAKIEGLCEIEYDDTELFYQSLVDLVTSDIFICDWGVGQLSPQIFYRTNEQREHFLRYIVQSNIELVEVPANKMPEW